MAVSYRKPAFSRVSCNSCPAQNHIKRQPRMPQTTHKYILKSKHMQESVSKANAVQWKYIRVNCYSFHIAFHDTVLVNSTYIWYILYVKCHNSLYSDVILFENYL